MDITTLEQKGYIKNLFPYSDQDLSIFKEVASKISDKTVNQRKNVFDHFPIIQELFKQAIKTLNLNLELTSYCFYIEKNSKRNWPLLFHRDINLPDYISIDGNRETFLENAVMFRFTLDKTDKDTGALKVIEGSHKHTKEVKNDPIHFLETEPGEVILFKPLLMHGSNRIVQDHQRRVFQALCVPSSTC